MGLCFSHSILYIYFPCIFFSCDQCYSDHVIIYICSFLYFFSYQQSYEVHMKHHSDDSCIQYRCYKCLQCFISFRFLNLHFTTHDNPKEFGCSICAFNFGTLTLLLRHYMFHNQKFIMRCGIHQYSDMEHYSEQCRLHQEIMFCKDCGRIAMYLDTGSHNVMAYHPMYTCNICNASVDREKGLAHHRRVVHNLGYNCTHCSETLFSPLNFKLHMNVHGTSAQFLCEFCGKDFIMEKDKYEDHLMAHLISAQISRPTKSSKTNKLACAMMSV